MIIKILLLFVLVLGAEGQAQFNLTVVTGLWNIGRHNFYSSSRGYDFYLNHFKQLLQYDGNMIIFGTQLQYNFTQQHRPKVLLESKTLFVRKELVDFEKYWYTHKIWQVIEEKPKTLNKYKAIQITQTPQYGLKMYNPVVMSKHRLIFEASQLDPFYSEYLLWLDGGFTHLMPFSHIQQHFYHHMVGLYQPGWFIQTGKYGFQSLSLGFKDGGRQYSPKGKVTTQVLGNWVGGRIEAASTAYHIYQNLLRVTFENLDMNTDQSIFILMVQRFPYFFNAINNSVGSAYYDLKIQVEKRTLHHRQFNWKDLKPNIKIRRDDQYIDHMQVIKVMKLSDELYFNKWRSIYEKTFNKRIIVLFVLLVATLLVYYVVSSSKHTEYLEI